MWHCCFSHHHYWSCSDCCGFFQAWLVPTHGETKILLVITDTALNLIGFQLLHMLHLVINGPHNWFAARDGRTVTFTKKFNFRILPHLVIHVCLAFQFVLKLWLCVKLSWPKMAKCYSLGTLKGLNLLTGYWHFKNKSQVLHLSLKVSLTHKLIFMLRLLRWDLFWNGGKATTCKLP